MNPLIRKEIRLLMPAWIAAVVLVIMGTWVGPMWIWNVHDSGTYSFVCFGLGALLVSLSVFGLEFSLGTFPQLLAQPAQRSRIWNVKLGVGCFALLSILALMCLGWGVVGQIMPADVLVEERSREFFGSGFRDQNTTMTVMVAKMELFWVVGQGAAIALAALTSALWTTLIFRQVTAAFWLAAGVPGAIACFTASFIDSHKLSGYKPEAIYCALLGYSVVAFLFARKLFFRAQDAQWTGGTIGAPSFGKAFGGLAFVRRSAVYSLIHKELQLHIVPVFMALGLTLLSGVLVFLNKSFPSLFNSWRSIGGMLCVMLWGAIPVIVGASAVAEERKLNTLEGLLCLPRSRRLQFTIKFGVALLVGVILGGLLPGFIWESWLNPKPRDEFWSSLAFLGAAAALITWIAFYASTLTRNIIQAIGAAICVAAVCYAFVVASMVGIIKYPSGLFIFIGLFIFGLSLLGLAYNNFRRSRIDRSGWVTNILVIVLAWGLYMTASAAIYNRAWEFATEREPKHHQARLNPAQYAKICSGPRENFMCLFALLPDGRIWAADEFRISEVWAIGKNKKKELQGITSTPLHGSFLTKSNWSDITRGNKVYGLQSNGTLWSIAIPHYQWRREVGTFDQKIPSWTIEQIGSDDDWAAISGSMTHCLALKRNGTLWGWGDSGLGELGPGPDRVTNGPIRIGKDSDWVSIFADISSSCGVKADGTIWRWGSLYEPVAGSSRQNLPQKHLKPLRCSLAGTNYVSIQSPGSFSMGLRDDGALFLFGTWHRKLFDCVLEGFNSPPKQVGDPEWRYFSMNHFAGAGLKRDGTLWIEAMNYWEELRRRPSQYNDWMALGLSEVDLVALATDGTLCSWSTGTRTWDLCVTRRAQWSLNIFEQGR